MTLLFDADGILTNFNNLEFYDLTNLDMDFSKYLKIMWYSNDRYNFETGKTTKKDFLSCIANRLQLDKTPEEMEDIYKKCLCCSDEIDINEVFNLLKSKYKIGLCINSNPIKTEFIKGLLETEIDYFISSQEIGILKPRIEFFREVNKRYNLEKNTFFFDDKIENVKTAQKIGWKAIQLNETNIYGMINSLYNQK